MNSSTPNSAWHDARSAIRQNFVPGVVLWLLAAVVVLGYYFVPAIQAGLAEVARWKAAGGYLYSLVATGLFAGLIPWLLMRAMPATRSTATWGAGVFLVLFWAYRGVEVDLFYRFQGWLFGNEATVGTVAAKVVVDMFVYNVVWAAHGQLITYHWKDSGFRRDAFAGYDWGRYWKRSFPGSLLSVWAVWLPVLALVYALPPDLQIPLFNLAACFWSLVMAAVARGTRKD